MDIQLPDIREIAARNPFAVGRYRYSCTLRELSRRGYHDEDSVLLIILDCVVIFRNAEGYEHGVFCPAGVLCFATVFYDGSVLVRLDPYEGPPPPLVVIF